MANVIVAGILLIVLCAAGVYLVKAKKKGQKCIGCPACGKCGTSGEKCR